MSDYQLAPQKSGGAVFLFPENTTATTCLEQGRKDARRLHREIALAPISAVFPWALGFGPLLASGPWPLCAKHRDQEGGQRATKQRQSVISLFRLPLPAGLCWTGFAPAGFYREVSVMLQLQMTSSSRELSMVQLH